MANVRDLAIGKVATAPSPADSGTSLVLETGQGGDMPTTLPYKVLAYPEGEMPTKYNSEKLLVTDQVGDTLTITRAQGETTAKSIAVGWFVSNNIFTEDVISSGNSFVNDESPSGAVDGSNTSFTTSQSYLSGSLEVFINGVKQANSTHVTQVDPSLGTFTLDVAPQTGDIVRVSYQHSTGASGNADTVDGFHASQTSAANSIPVLDDSGLLPWWFIGNSWESWTPTFSNLSGGTLDYAKYHKFGKTVHYRIKYTLGSAGVAGDVLFSLPVVEATDYSQTGVEPMGQVVLRDAGTAVYTGQVVWVSAETAAIRRGAVTGSSISILTLTASNPFTWASGDQILVEGRYEAA